MSDSERFSVCEISHLSKISSMPLYKAGSWLWGYGKVSCFLWQCVYYKTCIVSLVEQMAWSGTRKQAISSFRAIERDEKAADRRSVDRACKAKKRALETEEEAFEHTDTFLHISAVQ